MEMVFMLDTVFAGKALKGSLAYHSVREAYRKGYLKRVISAGSKESDIDPGKISSALPSARFLNSLLMGAGRRMHLEIHARRMNEHLFDIFGSRKIPECDLFYFQPPIWARSLEKAKSNGSITAVRDSTGNLHHSLKLAMKEHASIDAQVRSLKSQAEIRNLVMRKADWIFAYSEFSKGTHMDQGHPEEKIVVTGMGVDTEEFSPPEEPWEGAFRGLYVGAGVPLKGIKYMLMAWKGFSKKDQEIVICGNMDNSIRETLDHFRTRISMKTPGFVNPAHYYRKASVFIFPSLTEGFGKVILEALASGLPVITTTNTGGNDLIKDGKEGFIVPIRDSKGIEDSLRYLSDNPGELKRMGRNARKLAERNSWKSFSKRMSRFYEMAHEAGPKTK